MDTMTSQYVYDLKSTGASSDRYGCCEVCKQHAAEVWMQAEMRSYSGGLTVYLCRPHAFGHRDCLTKIRR